MENLTFPLFFLADFPIRRPRGNWQLLEPKWQGDGGLPRIDLSACSIGLKAKVISRTK
jgi:hypothetical protein